MNLVRDVKCEIFSPKNKKKFPLPKNNEKVHTLEKVCHNFCKIKSGGLLLWIWSFIPIILSEWLEELYQFYFLKPLNSVKGRPAWQNNVCERACLPLK